MTQWIDIHAKYYWHDIPNELGDYLLQTTKSADELDSVTSLLSKPSKSFYIELDVLKIDESRLKKGGKHELVNLDKEIMIQKIMMIEGEMGSGKSKLILNYVKEFSKPESFSSTRTIPVYFPYSTLLDEYNGDINKCVENALGAVYGKPYTKNVKYLFLVDGVDELADEDGVGFDKLVTIVNDIQNCENIRAIFTTRPLSKIDGEVSFQKRVSRYSIRPLGL